MSSRPPRQVRFVSAQLRHFAPDRCEATVELKGAAATYLGRAQGGCVDVGAFLSAAQAAADALRERGHNVKVDAVEMLQAFGEPAVVARVAAHYEGETRTLVGFCVAGDDPMRATVLAVLNATNRFLEIG